MATRMQRSAAYTRTRVFQDFLTQISRTMPERFDNGFAEGPLGLKGGDIRAFLQTLRVFGLMDGIGRATERARRLRSELQRPVAIREALTEAYPELAAEWEAAAGLPKSVVEDHFKLHYSLSASTAGPAAKLFIDLAQQYPAAAERRGSPISGSANRVVPPTDPAQTVVSPKTVEVGATAERPVGTLKGASAGLPLSDDPRSRALAALGAVVQIRIDSSWSSEQMAMAFDRIDRLVDRVLG
jgi:hypothetical protein